MKPSCESRLGIVCTGLGFTEVSCCLFNRIQEFVKYEPRRVIHIEKQLRWAHNLGRAESLGIPKVVQTVLARSMESQIWQRLIGSVAL